MSPSHEPLAAPGARPAGVAGAVTIQPLREPAGTFWDALAPLRGCVLDLATLPNGSVHLVATCARRTYQASGPTQAAALQTLARLVAGDRRRQD